MNAAQLTKHEVEAEPFRVWNAFINLIAKGYEEMSAEQKQAHLVFRYESEIQNGGHLQYFENCGAEGVEDTIHALGLLGAVCQQNVLRDAGALFRSREREPMKSVEEYVATALEDEFGEFDRRFEMCSPSLQECLEEHLKQHQSTFVVIV